MYRFILIILFVVLAMANSFGQKENNNWWLGHGVYFSFNTTPPTAKPANLYGSVFHCWTSSISDSSGHHLFTYSGGYDTYNNGYLYVYDGYPQWLDNGDNLYTYPIAGYSPGGQPGVVVKKPQSSSLYYVFHIRGNLYYSFVNMAANNGAGSVTLKNQMILGKVLDHKICAIKKANDRDIWIVVHEFATSNFYSIRLGRTGINAIVKSICGYAYNNSNFVDNTGILKASPSGDKIFLTQNNDVNASLILGELFDFNTASGVVSNPLTLQNNFFGLNSYAEFSSDGTKLYVSQYRNDIDYNDLMQFDLTPIGTNIQNSKVLIESIPNTYKMALNLGPDGKIYLSNTQYYFDIIHNPNARGKACCYKHNEILLSTDGSEGLMTGELNNGLSSLNYKKQVDHKDNCFGDTTWVTLNFPGCSDSLLWYFDDPASGAANYSDKVSTGHYFTSAGSYHVFVKTFIGNMVDTYFYNITVYPSNVASFSVNDSLQCLLKNSFIFTNTTKPSFGAVDSFFWKVDNSTTKGSSLLKKQFTDTGLHRITLIVKNSSGCRDTAFAEIRVKPSPKAIFTVNPANACMENNLFAFTDKSLYPLPSTANRLWITENDTLNNIANVSYHYNHSDTFQMRLIAFTNEGCTDTSIKQIIVFPTPKSDFTINDTIQCVYENQFIVNNSILDSIIKHCWISGNNTAINSMTDTFTFNQSGTFNISLITENKFGCEDTIIKSVKVAPSPVAIFSASDSALCLDHNLFTFNAINTLPGDQLVWYYGDGFSDTLARHVYLNDGIYLVRLIQSNIYGCIDTFEKSFFVNPMPFAGFNINDTIQCFKGNNFIFADPINPANEQQWMIETDTSRFLSVVNKAFSLQGNYQIRHIVGNTFGCYDTFNRSVQVLPSPDATFSLNDSLQCFRNNRFTFTATANLAADILHWATGDGTNGNVNPYTYSYIVHGTYYSRLLVTNTDGCTDSLEKVIIVHPSASAGFIINDTNQCFKGNSFDFKNTSINASGYNWSTGDGDVSSTISFIHSYLSNGTYTVRLIALTPFLCHDTIEKQIIVKENPAPPVITTNSPVCEGNSIELNSPLLTNTLYYWYGPAGFNASSDHVTISEARLRDSGYYYLKISVFGCESDSNGTFIRINPSPFPELGPEKTICDGDEIILNPGDFATYLWQDGSTESTFKAHNNGLYSVIVSNSYNCTGSDNVMLIHKCPTTVYIPNSFSPTGDGHNDLFFVVADNIATFELLIYNRWGAEVFRTNDISGAWDGTYKGTPCTQDYYNYQLKITDNDQRIRTFSGMLLLVR